MANNFEIIFNVDEPMILADGSFRKWLIQDVIDILECHNCEYMCSPHIPDEFSSFNHWHVGIHTSSNNEYSTIAKWFGLPTNSIQKIKKNFKTTYALYLIHYNQKGKTPVPPEKVLSNFDIGYDKLIQNIEKSNRLEQILKGIDEGLIKKFNLHEYINMIEYTKWKRQIDNGFEYRINKIKGVNRNMECVFITGDSGTGKTTYAKEICQNHNYSMYISSGSNDVLDDYQGQDAIILDDLRPSCLNLSDLLKMLDNNTASSVKSRFRNKVLECKLIVITTTKDIETFFHDVFENENETKIQLMRRCKTYMRFTKDKITISLYNEKTKEYDCISVIDNLITQRYKVEDMTTEQKLDVVANILGASFDMVNKMKKGITENTYIPEGFDTANNIPF